MKIAGILLSSLIIMAILPSIGLTFAESAISIATNQSVYEYGDHLVMIISVSEITGDDASIYITDPTERRSLLLQQPISQEYTEFPSKFPFDATIWKPGTYVLELEYLGDKSSTQFIIEDTGKIALPFWIKDLAHMWITEPLVTDKDFARALEYLIEKGIISIPYTEPGTETVSSIPEWVKNNAEWWIEGKISDTEFALALQYLVKAGIITVNLSNV
ncbi:uncharacterized protein METZ01_LOCUS237600 [marine metagenome]|uniref:Uncharacterized protein n=1 Tax=marine metagenome TaxID=408172 RepID=A0A382HBU5_9ZZZZ